MVTTEYDIFKTSMRVPEWIIHRSRRTSGGVLSISIAGISSVIFVISGSRIFAKSISAVLAISVVSILIWSRYFVQELSLTCVQVEPDDYPSAKSQHFKQFLVEDGYIELEVFVEIPDWVNEFEIVIETSKPFRFSAWKLPDSVKFTDRRIICRQNMKEFSFILTAGGNSDDLGDGIHTLRFIDYHSSKEIDSIALHTKM